MLFRSDRKSTRLNSSHTIISYAVFCLKKKKNQPEQQSHEHMRAHTHVLTRNQLCAGCVAVCLRWRSPPHTLLPSPSFFFFFLNNPAPPKFSPFPPPAPLPI